MENRVVTTDTPDLYSQLNRALWLGCGLGHYPSQDNALSCCFSPIHPGRWTNMLHSVLFAFQSGRVPHSQPSPSSF